MINPPLVPLSPCAYITVAEMMKNVMLLHPSLPLRWGEGEGGGGQDEDLLEFPLPFIPSR